MLSRLTDQRGFTLVDVLVAVALISFGLIAIMAAYPTGIAGVETGRQESTAAFLAEQLVEQVKNQALTNFATVGSSTENYTTIPNGANFRRVATVTNLSSTLRQVQISVFYRPVIVSGVSTTEREVRIFTFVASRS